MIQDRRRGAEVAAEGVASASRRAAEQLHINESVRLSAET
jgi:hypothetical protein